MMYVLVKLGGFCASQCQVLAASKNGERLEAEAKRLLEENELNRMVDSEIWQLSDKLISEHPFTLPKPEDSDQVVEWQNLGFRHANQLKDQAQREVLVRHGKQQQEPFDHNLVLDIWETKEL